MFLSGRAMQATSGREPESTNHLFCCIVFLYLGRRGKPGELGDAFKHCGEACKHVPDAEEHPSGLGDDFKHVREDEDLEGELGDDFNYGSRGPQR